MERRERSGRRRPRPGTLPSAQTSDDIEKGTTTSRVAPASETLAAAAGGRPPRPFPSPPPKGAAGKILVGDGRRVHLLSVVESAAQGVLLGEIPTRASAGGGWPERRSLVARWPGRGLSLEELGTEEMRQGQAPMSPGVEQGVICDALLLPDPARPGQMLLGSPASKSRPGLGGLDVLGPLGSPPCATGCPSRGDQCAVAGEDAVWGSKWFVALFWPAAGGVGYGRR